MRERRQRGHRQRQHEPPEDRGVVGAVDPRRLEDLLGERRHVVVEQEDGQGQCGPDVGDPHGRRGAGEIEVGEQRERLAEQGEVGAARVELEQRDQRHLQRHGHERDHADEHPAAALEVHPGEGVGRECGQREGDQRGRHRDGQGVEEVLPHVRRVRAGGVEHGAVVVERQLRIGDHAPPPGGLDVLLRTEGRDEHPEGREGPEADDDPQHEGGERGTAAAQGAVARRCAPGSCRLPPAAAHVDDHEGHDRRRTAGRPVPSPDRGPG